MLYLRIITCKLLEFVSDTFVQSIKCVQNKTKLKLCWRKTSYIYTPIYQPESTYLISCMGQLPTFLATFSKTCLLKWQQQIEVLAKYSFRIKAFLLCRVFRSILVYINPCVPVHLFFIIFTFRNRIFCIYKYKYTS